MATMSLAKEQPQGAGASASSPPGIRILDSTVVCPSPLPSGSALPESSVPLTFFDVFWLRGPAVEYLFLYRLAPDADIPAILSNLKDSLSQAVRTFYPLAGRLRPTPGTSNRYELYYHPGDGVAFTVAEYDAGTDDDIDRLAANDPREVAKLALLVPSLPAGGAVLALQATLLPGRRGLAVGVTVHHAACDGAAVSHFLNTWAAAACARSDAPPPVIDRSLVIDPIGLYDVICRPAQATAVDGGMELFKPPADQLLATFTVSKDDAQRVKDAVAAEAARRDVMPPRCTSLVATLGLVWSCYLRAKDDTGATAASALHTSGDPARACLSFAVDLRSRMMPPLPDKYFGNCVAPAVCVAPRDDVAATGVGGLFSACATIAAAIDEAVSGFGTSSMDSLLGRIIEVARNIGMLKMAGSPKFPFYDVDLGFGRPAKVDMVSPAKASEVILVESRHGAGGIEVGVSLPPDAMNRFHKCFADATAALQNQN